MLTIELAPVPAYALRFAYQQGRQAADLHPDRQGRPDRGIPVSPDSQDLQAVRRSHGAAAPPALD